MHELTADLIKRMPRYNQLPVSLLGPLAVDQTARGHGIGQLLLADALRRSLQGSRQIAAHTDQPTMPAAATTPLPETRQQPSDHRAKGTELTMYPEPFFANTALAGYSG